MYRHIEIKFSRSKYFFGKKVTAPNFFFSTPCRWSRPGNSINFNLALTLDRSFEKKRILLHFFSPWISDKIDKFRWKKVNINISISINNRSTVFTYSPDSSKGGGVNFRNLIFLPAISIYYNLRNLKNNFGTF